MTKEEWIKECDHAVEALGAVCQAVIKDSFDIVRVRDANGNELTGIKLADGRVPFLVVPQDKQVPLRGAEETLQ